MSAIRILAVLVLFATLSPAASFAAENAKPSAPPAFVLARDFSWNSLADPEPMLWPWSLWWWNGPLEPDVLRRQIGDMKAHDVRNFMIYPLPRNFLPGDYDMDPDYLTPEFFDRVKLAVDEAARLGMNCWLNDEGGFPPPLVAGRIMQEHPELATRTLVCNADGKWTERTGDKSTEYKAGRRGDALNPKTADAVFAIARKPFSDALGSHFGRTLKFFYTDEPMFSAYPKPGRVIPWTAGGADIFRRWFGYDVMDKLDAFRVTNLQELTPAQKKVRVDLFDFWSRRFRDAYFLPLRDWCRERGMAQVGRPGGEDETFGAVCYGFGHVMRPFRAMDMPGVDAIWRQIFPDKQNHHYPKFASTAVHQNGTALAVTESFAVYGSGLTPAQMKWVIDYQYVRGINLYLGSNYPITTRGHSMSGERPRFGPVEPMWDFLTEFHRYVARLSYVLACGQPDIKIGLYYPVRDIWATGDPNDPALHGHDALARSLSQHQCDYDIVDDDVLSDPTTRVEDGHLAIGPMRYRTIALGLTQWMTEASKKRLESFAAAGGQVIRVDDLGQIDATVAKIAPTVQLDPPSPDIRVLVRRWPGGGALFLFNEGQKPYTGLASLHLDGKPHEIEPATGLVRAIEIADASGKQAIPLNLEGGQSKLLVSGRQDAPADVAPPVAHTIAKSVDLADGWTARVDRQYVVGEHDFEIHPTAQAEFKPATPGRWATPLGLTEDFSGHVTYRRMVSVPESMRGRRLLLDFGGVEYAARVSIDGRKLGCVLWSPWRIELPPLENPSEFVLEIQVSNTLANELTSRRVRDAWAKKPPGWINRNWNYHSTALRFEVESRDGGLLGPVRLQLAAP